jgi:membrane protein YqaA with SNARE-associated domain
LLAATLLPFSSEAAVLAALAAGGDPLYTLLAASAGNCAGALITFGMGWTLGDALRPRLLKTRGGPRALRWAERWGPWSLLGSWLPVVGDPLLLLAGALRLPWWSVVAFGLGTRVARYGVVIAAWASAS